MWIRSPMGTIPQVYDVDKGYVTHNFSGHRGIVSGLRFHPDPQRLQLVSWSDDTDLRVWDLISQKCAATLTDHYAAPVGVAFSEDGWLMTSAGRDEVLITWNLRTFQRLKLTPVFEPLESVTEIPRRFWTEKQGQPAVPTQPGQPTPVVSGLVMTGGVRGRLRVWQVVEHRKKSAGESKRDYDCKCILERQLGQGTTEGAEGGRENALNEPAEAGKAKADLPLSAQVETFVPLWLSKRGEEVKEGDFGDHGDLLCVTRDQTFVNVTASTLELGRTLVGNHDEILALDFVPDLELRPGGGPVFAMAANSEQVRAACRSLGVCVSSIFLLLSLTASPYRYSRLWD